MQVDLGLKTRQSFWETPRNLVIMGAALSGVVATLVGLAGYKFAQATPTQIVFQPGSIVVTAPQPK